jgi:hypothetical protein
MSFSVDLVFLIINLLVLAYSFGKFSEKISSLEKQIAALTKVISEMSANYYSAKDGAKLEANITKIWDKLDKITV